MYETACPLNDSVRLPSKSLRLSRFVLRPNTKNPHGIPGGGLFRATGLPTSGPMTFLALLVRELWWGALRQRFCQWRRRGPDTPDVLTLLVPTT